MSDTRDLKKQESLASLFPVGAKYSAYRDRTDRNWDKDFTLMKECGMTAIRVNATWGTVEPAEGEYDFSYYDHILERAASYGLKVLFTIYMSCAPEWAFEKHPDSRFVSAAGTVWTAETFADAATGGWPGLCLDGEDHRRTVEAFLKVFTEHFKGDERVLAFDLHHEPTEEPAQQYFQNDWRELMYCYCDHSKAKFRAWLKEKYGSLAGLNAVWVRQYQTWKQVEPPRTVGMYADWSDWKQFRSEAQVEAMQFLHNTVKKYDPDRATAIHTAIYETGHPVMSSNDHFRLVKAADMFGSSMYDCQNPEVTAFVCDLLRSANDNGPFWVGETSSGAGPMFLFIGRKKAESLSFSVPMNGQEILRQTWGQVARGAKGIFYWSWRPEISSIETATLGFTERNGDRTERCGALKSFTDVLGDYRAELAAAKAPKSEAAIFYNLDSAFIEGLVSLGSSGTSAIEKNKEKKYYKDTMGIMGAYKLCMKNQIQPDFVSKEDILSGKLTQYKLLLLPYSISITQEVGSAIAAFVKAGGKVIADGLLGYFTDGAWGSEVAPGGGLDQVFGVHARSDYEVCDEDDIYLGEKCCDGTCAAVLENLVVEDGAAICGCFADGRPAVVANSCGEGKTAYVGTLFFPNVEWNYTASTEYLFTQLLEQVDYRPPVKASGVKDGQILETRILEGETTFIFILNHEKETQEFAVSVPLGQEPGKIRVVQGCADAECSGGELHLTGKLDGDGVIIVALT